LQGRRLSLTDKRPAPARLLTLELLQLILRLRVLRVELNGGLEILDRGPLVALRVLRLRHHLIRHRRLGEVFEVRLQIRERIIRPSWIDGVRFDVNARTPAGTRSDQIPDMLRALLADRFSLVTHTETREGTVLALVPARTEGALGPQLTVSSLDCSKPEAPLSGSAGVNTQSAAARVEKPTCGLISTVDDNGGALRGGGRTMGDLAANLTGRMNQPVRDRTGLTGSYDFVLRWTPENFSNAATNAGPSRDGTPIVTALQEQLGLKLEAQRAPVEFLIIDRIERPSPD